MNTDLLRGLRPLADTLSGPEGAWHGVYVARVVDNQDPDNQGRVKVALPWSPDTKGEAYETWARVATLMAGKERGTWFVPDPEDEVVVAFEGGDPCRPVVLGSLWNGKDTPAEQMAQANPKRTILTGAGVRITLDDTQGAVSLLLETPGQQRVRLDDTPAEITVEDANGNSVTLGTDGVTVSGEVQVTIKAPIISLDTQMLLCTAPMSTFSGVTQHNTVTTATTISAAYMPGAGGLL